MTAQIDWRGDFVLPEDVEIVGIEAIPAAWRARLSGGDDRYVIHRRGSREHVKAIDTNSARLLSAFLRPRRVVDVVIALAVTMGLSAEQILDESFSLLSSVVAAGMLVPAGSEEVRRLAASLETGVRLGHWTIVECVRMVDDSEIYCARDGDIQAAIKRLRPHGISRGLKDLLASELEALRRLNGVVAPRVLEAATDDVLP